MVIVNNFSPFIVKFGDFGIRWYGMAYVLGFVLGYLWLAKAVREERVPGLDKTNVDKMLYALIAGVMLGGRLGFCLQNLGQWSKDPLFFFRIWEGGMAFFGGLAGVFIAVVWFARHYKVSFGALGDTITIPAALALAFGRIANFVNAELWGRPTGADWGVIYPRIDQLPRHPSELYECVTHLLLAGILALVIKLVPRVREEKRGLLSALFVILYGVFRFITEYFREEPITVGPLTSGQVASIVISLLGLVILFVVRRSWGRPSELETDPQSS